MLFAPTIAVRRSHRGQIGISKNNSAARAQIGSRAPLKPPAGTQTQHAHLHTCVICPGEALFWQRHCGSAAQVACHAALV